ncbi:hypothetical protein, partial [Enterococcus sp. HPCN18]|uniref:hypothetical protein n=1 Tax=Enterococcus sp. HPCN18 TaxID=2248751 RepID=UPI001C65E064
MAIIVIAGEDAGIVRVAGNDPDGHPPALPVGAKLAWHYISARQMLDCRDLAQALAQHRQQRQA